MEIIGKCCEKAAGEGRRVKRTKKLKLVFPSNFYHRKFSFAAESTHNSIHIPRYLIYTSFDRSRRTYRCVRTRSIGRRGEDVRQLRRLSGEPAKWKDNGRRQFALFAREDGAPNKAAKLSDPSQDLSFAAADATCRLMSEKFFADVRDNKADCLARWPSNERRSDYRRANRARNLITSHFNHFLNVTKDSLSLPLSPHCPSSRKHYTFHSIHFTCYHFIFPVQRSLLR